ncbi:MAG: imidazolonepropionase, partial [Anaerolineae bacterium]|nr:imidazolonepropionase [Anaerolineae bacterium]
MLLYNASQLLTLSGGPQRGSQLGQLNIIENGAVLIQDETIVAVGKSADLLAAYPAETAYDAEGKVVLPGFVDPHTHLIWAGDRAGEFEQRLQGKTYLEILAAGGGILSTVNATRRASSADLMIQTRQRARTLLRYGTTTAEVKSGYGLDSETEERQLEVLLDLNAEGPLEIVPTYLGAHAIAPEYEGDPQAYTEHLCRNLIPHLAEWCRQKRVTHLPFVDVFCETGAFNLDQSRRILETAKKLGFPLKIHADEFDNLGGAALAAELGAVSADHLVKTSVEDINVLAHSNTVAVALPCTPFGLAETHYTPAKEILKANGLLAIASDINPGTAWC